MKETIKVRYDHETRSVSNEQERRRERNERLPAHDWDAKRKALIESGIVEERRMARDA